MVVYAVVNNNGHTELAMVSIDGKVHITLPSGEGDVREPAWSPFLTKN
jgi:TolB protein